jgi:hypothetical protein
MGVTTVSIPLIVVNGTVKPDGTLELEEKVPLPAGPVQVTVQPLPELPDDDPFWQRMRAIWDAQKARGHVPRGTREVEAERQAVRDEREERLKERERLREEDRAQRSPGQGAG